MNAKKSDADVARETAGAMVKIPIIDKITKEKKIITMKFFDWYKSNVERKQAINIDISPHQLKCIRDRN